MEENDKTPLPGNTNTEKVSKSMTEAERLISVKSLSEAMINAGTPVDLSMKFASVISDSATLLEKVDGMTKLFQERKGKLAYTGETLPLEKEDDNVPAHSHTYAILSLNYGEQIVGISTGTKGAKDHAHLIDVDIDRKIISMAAYTELGFILPKEGEGRYYHNHAFDCDVESLHEATGGSVYAKPSYCMSEKTAKEKKKAMGCDDEEDKDHMMGCKSKKALSQRQAEVDLIKLCKFSENENEVLGALVSMETSFPGSNVFNDGFVAEFADKKLDPNAKVRNRPAPVIPAEEAEDKKDHFPIDTLGRGRNALARVAQFDKAPTWWKGSLASLQKRVRDAVKKKYPSISVAKLSDIYSVRIKTDMGTVFINTDATTLSEAREDGSIYLKERAGDSVDIVRFVIDDEGKVEFTELGAFFFYEGTMKGVIRASSEQEINLSEKDAQGNVVIEILRTGTFNHPQYGTFEVTNTMLNEAIGNFKGDVLDRQVSFDFNHETELPAAAWCKNLSTTKRTFKGNPCEVLLAHVQFTPRGESAVKNGEFKYFSSEYVDNFVDKESGKKYGTTLKGGGLTNRPWIPGLKPIELSEKKDFAFINNL